MINFNKGTNFPLPFSREGLGMGYFFAIILCMKDLRERARYLRKNMTEQERKLWSILRNRQFHNYRFMRQYIIGNYIVDFVCCEKKIIIEADGGQHSEAETYDDNRTAFLNSKGYKVVRFWNNEIQNNLEGVYNKLEEIFR